MDSELHRLSVANRVEAVLRPEPDSASPPEIVLAPGLPRRECEAAASAARPDARIGFLRFVDRFLQEQNIKWILALGILILFGSSIKLVGTHWHASTAAWKHLILLGYTAAIFGMARLSYERMGLRKTGTVLMALTVLLVPLTFFGWHWVAREPLPSLSGAIRNLALLAANLVLGWRAARRVFSHFLRETQPTFVASYLLLSAAAAIVPAVPASWWPMTALVLWGIFTVGTTKVSRHVFWMTEEHRLPRIFGFFPIALLGTQFLLLFAWQIGPYVPLDWLGLACVLTAMPVLLTADAVARVFQQRTGNLVRPLPWSIVLPMVVGLGLCGAGIALATTELPLPMALMPTAALTAAMLGVTAHRTGQRGFVWGMLACLTVAYNFSYVLFLDFARFLLNTGATAVHEPRLPLAFYGLTYLPLLIAGTVTAAWLDRRGGYTPQRSDALALFARPLRQFIVGLCGLWLVVALTHAKALFPVSAVMSLLFGAQMVLFRERRLLGPAIVAFLTMAYGVTPFVERVLGWNVSSELPYYCLAVAAAALLFPGRAIDRSTERFVAGNTREEGVTPIRWCEPASRGAALLLASAWFSHSLAATGAATWGPCDLALTMLLALHALVATSPLLGGVTLGFAGSLALVHAVLQKMPASSIASSAAAILLVLWLVSYGLERRARWRVSQTFGGAARDLSLFGLTLLAVVYLIDLGLCLFTAIPDPAWVASFLVLAWAFDAARRTHRGGFTTLGGLLALAGVGAVWTRLVAPEANREWLAAVWSATALLAVPLAAAMKRRWLSLESRAADRDIYDPRVDAWRALALPIERLTVACATWIGVCSLLWFTWPLRIAGGLAVVGLLGQGALSRRPRLRQGGWILANWQALGLIVAIAAPELRTWLELTPAFFSTVALPLAAASAGSALLFRTNSATRFELAEFADAHCQLLRVVTAVGLGWSMISTATELPTLHLALAAVAFASVTIELLIESYRRQEARRVWLAEAVVASACLFFWKCGVIHLGRGLAMYAVLIAAVLMRIAGGFARRTPQTAIMADPFLRTSMALPLLTAAIGVGRHFLVAEPAWLGANSLALLLAAGFFFWRGLEGRESRWIVLSTVMLNVALALLWSELAWNDPQFFLIPLGLSVLGIVQLLQREIPQRWLDPLRYAGALTILVSPTFHIVEGSWLHLMTLMVAAVGVTLLSIGLHVRALMYTGTAFLVADLLAMVVRGGIDRPNVLWIAGIALGSVVILLGAICENHREAVLQRLRILAAELETWQ